MIVLKCDDRNGRWPSTGYDLIEYMETEFGNVSVREFHNCENDGWYLDQRLVTMLVAGWKREHGAGRVKRVTRDINRDRSVAV